MTTFDADDGVHLVPILKGFRPAVTKTSDGKIWFVNGDTVSFFDPSHIDINTLPPPVHIEQIIADGKTYDLSDGMRLPPLVRNLAFDFVALSLVAPEKIAIASSWRGGTVTGEMPSMSSGWSIRICRRSTTSFT